MIKPLDNTINFGYKSVLKTEFDKGKIPLQEGIYGGKIIPIIENPKDEFKSTLEHIVPKSKGGSSNISNYFLSNAKNNTARANKPIEEFIKIKPLVKYILVMLDVKTDKIDGVEYLKKSLKSLLYALEEGK